MANREATYFYAPILGNVIGYVKEPHRPRFNCPPSDESDLFFDSDAFDLVHDNWNRNRQSLAAALTVLVSRANPPFAQSLFELWKTILQDRHLQNHKLLTLL